MKILRLENSSHVGYYIEMFQYYSKTKKRRLGLKKRSQEELSEAYTRRISSEAQ